MRVLFWSEYYTPSIGGVEIVVQMLAEELVRRGYEAMVVTNTFADAPANEIRNGVRVHRFPLVRAVEQRNLAALHAASREIIALKRSFAPDVEHIHSTGPLLLVHRLVWRDAASPVIMSIHAIHERLRDLVAINGTAAALLRQSHRILVLSKLHRDSLLAALPDRADRIEIACYGLPPPATVPAPLLFDPPVLLCFGRVVHEKGFDLALRSLPLIQCRFPCARLIVAGEGHELPALVSLADELGLGQSVEFTGWIPPPEVPALLNRATLVLVPSRWQEPFAIAMLNSAQMGRPVVATTVGGFVDAMDLGLVATLAEPESPPALAAAVCNLLADPDHTRQQAALARQVALEHHSLDHYFEIHLNHYQAAAGRDRP